MKLVLIPIILASLTIGLAAQSQQAQPRPTAIQILAQQLAVALAHNAELHEKIGQLEDRVMQLAKQKSEGERK